MTRNHLDTGRSSGWNEKRVKDVIAYYDRQTPEEELAEYERGMRLQDHTMLIVPTRLLPRIESLISRERRSKQPKRTLLSTKKPSRSQKTE